MVTRFWWLLVIKMAARSQVGRVNMAARKQDGCQESQRLIGVKMAAGFWSPLMVKMAARSCGEQSRWPPGSKMATMSSIVQDGHQVT